MAKVLILAESGFGKSTSIGKIPQLGIQGLDPKETYIISATSKPLPFKGSGKIYPTTTVENLNKGKRIITSVGKTVAAIVRFLAQNSPVDKVKNIVIDDFNYILQDYYMKNAMKGGWDTPKEIGYFTGLIFDALELCHDRNIFVMAHYEEFKSATNNSVGYRMKTTGKMVHEYITPEGKFDIVLYGKQTSIEKEGGQVEVKKEFVTNFDGMFSAKSPVGMFEDLYIPNDLGYVKAKIEEYYS